MPKQIDRAGSLPDFKSADFLLSHIQSILDFYDPNVDDPHGGFYQNFNDQGEVYDKTTRHLVSSCRFVFNYAKAYLQFGRETDLQRVVSGIEFLRTRHRNQQTGGYAWLIDVNGTESNIVDATNHCYGLAFVILAYSWAYRAGVPRAKSYLQETWQLLNQHFWEDEFGLYIDEFNGDFTHCSEYRGQNANMHTCEALIAAYAATKDPVFINRALQLADNMVNRQARLSNGLVWEHYDQNWQVDLEYNKDDPKNLFRPWGFQPGHQTEWAKLLLLINQYQPKDWLITRARELFEKAFSVAWDDQHGGLCYGFAPDEHICDGEKYFWVQAESLACAAMLAKRTGDDKYWQAYEMIWQYSWQHMVDHEFGAWYRILSQDNQKLETTKSPIGKTDYHTMGACYDVLDCLSW